mgnify:CR=1 FL=1
MSYFFYIGCVIIKKEVINKYVAIVTADDEADYAKQIDDFMISLCSFLPNGDDDRYNAAYKCKLAC